MSRAVKFSIPIFASLMLPVAGVQAQQTLDFSKETFSTGKDENFLPGVDLGSEDESNRPTPSYDAARDVKRWEKMGKRGRIISRQTWTDEDGNARGRFSLGRSILTAVRQDCSP